MTKSEEVLAHWARYRNDGNAELDKSVEYLVKSLSPVEKAGIRLRKLVAIGPGSMHDTTNDLEHIKQHHLVFRVAEAIREIAVVGGAEPDAPIEVYFDSPAYVLGDNETLEEKSQEVAGNDTTVSSNMSAWEIVHSGQSCILVNFGPATSFVQCLLGGPLQGIRLDARPTKAGKSDLVPAVICRAPEEGENEQEMGSMEARHCAQWLEKWYEPGSPLTDKEVGVFSKMMLYVLKQT